MAKSSRDLTVGSITADIILFTLPILLGQIFQNLYNSVDSIVVGRYVGTTALAAVSSCSDISMLLTGFFTGLSAGAGVLFSRFFGAKQYDRLHDAIHTAVTFSVLLGTAMAALGVVLTPLLLHVVDCPADVYGEAEQYLRVYLIGILFTAIYNVGAGVLRAVGDSRFPFICLLISSLLNIVLDLVTVQYFRMGVLGVALATIMAQGLSVVLVYGKMLRSDDVYRLTLRDLRIDRPLLGEVIRLGIPAAVQASLISLSNLFVQRYANAFGSAAMAGIGAAKKIDKVVGMIGQTLGLASTTFVSQNLGARAYRRVFDGIRICRRLMLVCVVVMTVPVFVFAPTIVRIFTEDEAAVSYGVAMIRIMVPPFFLQGLNAIYSNVVRGFGKSTAVMVLSLSGMIGLRQLFLAISMHFNHSVTNVYIGYPLGWFFSVLFVVLYYLRLKKRFLAAHPELTGQAAENNA